MAIFTNDDDTVDFGPQVSDKDSKSSQTAKDDVEDFGQKVDDVGDSSSPATKPVEPKRDTSLIVNLENVQQLVHAIEYATKRLEQANNKVEAKVHISLYSSTRFTPSLPLF